eukprot:scaffold2032_cov112-Isochrysis_galbana.AAC.3
MCRRGRLYTVEGVCDKVLPKSDSPLTVPLNVSGIHLPFGKRHLVGVSEAYAFCLRYLDIWVPHASKSRPPRSSNAAEAKASLRRAQAEYISRAYAAYPLPPAPQPPPWGWWHGCHRHSLAAASPASQARQSDGPTSSICAAAPKANNRPPTRVLRASDRRLRCAGALAPPRLRDYQARSCEWRLPAACAAAARPPQPGHFDLPPALRVAAQAPAPSPESASRMPPTIWSAAALAPSRACAMARAAACRARRSGSPAISRDFPSATGAPSSCSGTGGIPRGRKFRPAHRPRSAAALAPPRACAMAGPKAVDGGRMPSPRGSSDAART